MHVIPVVGQTCQFYSADVADRDPENLGWGYDGLGAGPYAAIVIRDRRNSNEVVTHVDLRVFPPSGDSFVEEWVGGVSDAGRYFTYKAPILAS